jgi:hypothetical protein
MVLKVSSPPGFVVATCGGETVIVSGVLVAQSAGVETLPSTSESEDALKNWFPITRSRHAILHSVAFASSLRAGIWRATNRTIKCD